ncbi:hypothetical protein SAMN04489835_4572 [Mycolicibacterium rutilum]|uniref:Uncharacterized protein n=1 Tax=Mycolicibacterium rutilum TaxID=370526 RepID=A0A1H6L2S5_MYCRU|nr:DUF5336 domain-containing protein [Mycolicibacterium rutilum]SEH82439.1 hypothetical protein SAMN04489835_4572 [Mycolicibacterium rutilum]
MVYSPDNYPRSAQQGSETGRVRTLLVAVAALGALTYGVGYADPGEAALWSVRFAAAAGLVAGLGLLTKVDRVPLVAAVLAVLAFLEALWTVVGGAAPGWAPPVIAALTALQGIAAAAALLAEGKSGQAAPAGYEAYVDYYNQAVRNYYDQHAQATAEQTPRGGYGQARGAAQASAHDQRAQRPSQYADYTELGYAAPPTAPAQTGSSTAEHTAGLPNVGQAPGSAERYRYPHGESAPPSPPA